MFKKIRFPEGGSFEKSNKLYKKLTMCKRCYSFFYKKIWHFEAPDSFHNEDESEVSVLFSVCPACIEQEIALYEDSDNDSLSYGY